MATINGTAGDDLLLANSNNGDVLTSGLGQDIFQISGLIIPTIPHLITDFDRLNDTIQVDLPVGSPASDLTTAQTGNDATISLGGNPLAIIQNTLVEALSDIIVVVDVDPPTDPAINNAPIGTPTIILSDALQNTVVNIAAADLLAGFSDPDAGTILTVTDLLTSNGSVANNDGNFTLTPVNNFSGLINLTYSVSDGSTTLGGQTRSLNVLPPLLAPITAGLFQLSQGGGATTTLLFNKISHQTTNRNELGVFTVDDNNGTINGVTPGQSGYLTEVLKRSQVVFSALSGNAVDTALDGLSTRTIDIPVNASFGFYLTTNGTIDDNPNPGNIVFSFPTSNNGFQNTQTTQTGGIAQVAFEETSGGGDQDFNDLVFQIQTAPTSAPIGITQQSSREILDLTSVFTDVTVDFEVKRDAAFNNRVGFYRIEDAQGTVRSGTSLIKPGEDGYRQAVLQNRIAGIDLAGTNGQTITSNGVLQAEALYAPLLIANASSANADFSNVYTAYSLGNADRADHIRLLADNTFGFEDLVGGGDRDFNDVIVKATFRDPLRS
jgi:hypothetical protein